MTENKRCGGTDTAQNTGRMFRDKDPGRMFRDEDPAVGNGTTFKIFL